MTCRQRRHTTLTFHNNTIANFLNNILTFFSFLFHQRQIKSELTLPICHVYKKDDSLLFSARGRFIMKAVVFFLITLPLLLKLLRNLHPTLSFREFSFFFFFFFFSSCCLHSIWCCLAVQAFKKKKGN